MTKKNRLIILLFSFFGVFMVVHLSLAVDFGFTALGNGLANSLAPTDPRVVVGRIIQIALSFLGAIAVLIIIFAGFLWTTSEGNEEKIEKAKSILKNAVIGLLIILSSWGITTFIISQIMNATGGNGIVANPGASNNGELASGFGAIGTCSVDSIYPSNGQTDVPRNTSLMITFKEPIKMDNLCVDNSNNVCTCNNTSACQKINPLVFRLYKTDLGDACTGTSCSEPNTNVTQVDVSVASGTKTLVLKPISPLGNANTNTNYSLKLTNQIKKLDDSSIFQTCSSDFFNWSFAVNTSFDLTPPLVLADGIFPIPDNEKDSVQQVVPAQAAQASIKVNACPSTYQKAKLNSITPIGNSSDEASVILNYHGSLSNFKVIVPAGAPNKAQLFDNNNNPLGIADFDVDGKAVFPNYLTFNSTVHNEGDAWDINISPERLADSLSINSTVYSFATSTGANNILVPSPCNLNTQAINIQAKLSGDSNVNVSRNANLVTLTAKVAGEGGNDISLSTTNNSALSLVAFSGGTDLQEIQQINDKKDRPMNSALQITFDEAINPLTVSGSANEVSQYIKVVNAASSSPAGSSCVNDADCKSYKCDSGSCVGNYLGGKFMVSNIYRTVEFISDRECGVNACGDKIYCLPANSHLAVELSAANLKTCQVDADCSAYSPFQTCAMTSLGYKTCQNETGKNYPMANIDTLDGIIDAAANSLDGNRDTFSAGPVSFYNDNYTATSSNNIAKQDKYKWSFYVNDQINLSPPQISTINPVQGASGIALKEPVEITFNTLMLNSSLRTGSITTHNGTSTVRHKLINLKSSSPSALAYWIENSNIDVPPLDGEPDITLTKILHSPFAESVSFIAQVGSGVKDIYQNCFKPSVGPDCAANPDQPSCCFGSPTATLDADGNCQ